ncbi:MAG: T9SS type A sorting domain-containing protein [Saprospiraceae bacterium]|nr:T9SS type A sorting domain-containing protein [Saprospiraceae bacterium]
MRHSVLYSFFAFIFCLFSMNMQAQDFPYSFSAFTDTYTPITNGISVNNGQAWDDPDFAAPIGFDFELFGGTMNTIYWNGFLGAIFMGGDYYSASPAIAVYGSDLIDRGYFSGAGSLSPIVFELVGTAPNRIFKMEYQNAGFYDEDPSLSYVNFQLWLYETSNVIEMRYGENSVVSPVHGYSNGPKIGLIDLVDIYTYDFGTFYYLNGNTGDPSIQEVDVYDYYYLTDALDGEPVDGQVYRFAPAVSVNATFTVDMTKVVADGGTVSPNGIHIAGNFQGWDPAATAMNDNGDGTWTYTTSVTSNQDLLYKFVNGTTWVDAEINITLDCGIDDGNGNINRVLSVGDTDVETISYCFDYCETCTEIISGINQTTLANGLEIFPNPASEMVQIQIQLPEVSEQLQLNVLNMLGQCLYQQKLGTVQNMLVELPIKNLPAGIYQIQLVDGGVSASKTLIKQ